jgi:hypothetical protein
MIMRVRTISPIVFALLMSAVVPAIYAGADDSPVTLKYVYKVGDSLHHQTLIKANVQGLDAVVKQSRKSVVKEVKDNGDITVLVTDEGGTLTLSGADQHQDPGPDVTVKLDKLGKVTDWKAAMDIPPGALTAEQMRAMDQLYTIIFPAAPVKANDTWKLELDNPVYDKMKIKVENTYVGIEKVDGVDLWKIKQKATVPTDGEGNVTTFEGSFWLNPANGQLTKLDGNVKDLPTQFGKISFTILLTPVKDDKPSADKATAPK